jgi:hypothetical protein
MPIQWNAGVTSEGTKVPRVVTPRGHMTRLLVIALPACLDAPALGTSEDSILNGDAIPSANSGIDGDGQTMVTFPGQQAQAPTAIASDSYGRAVAVGTVWAIAYAP